ncbi:fatty acid hydroxylase superfamily protein, partial [Ascobolus immersus RN42]
LPTEVHITPVPSLLSWVSDSNLMIFLPIIAYWIPSLLFHLIDKYDLFSKYRLHTPEELLKRNHVTMREVIKDVCLQQVLQMVVGWLLSLSEGQEMTGHEEVEIIGMLHNYMKVESAFVSLLAVTGVNSWALVNKLDKAVSFDWRLKLVESIYHYAIPLLRLWVAVFFLDTWQYFWHRTMHTVPWLYRTFHSRHHRLYVPYAFGALYNHPFEGLLMDTFGAGIGFKLAGLTQRQGLYFFTFGTLKTIDDHCGYKIPWDPFQFLFANNAAYHDIHHQGWGIKTNFSQPFFICWDRWLSTQ